MSFKSTLALGAMVILLPTQNTFADEGIKREETIVVVASHIPTAKQKVGRAITVLDQHRIENLGYGYGADLFRFVPGVAVNRQGGFGGLTQLRIRGAEANHSVVLIDGIDVTAAGTGEFDFSSLLSADIERIEVLRGPQSGLYGSNALAGVVSVHTRRPNEGFGADINFEAGSFDTRHSSISLSGGSAALKGRLTYVNRRSEFDLSANDALLGGEDDKDANQTLSGQLRAVINDTLDVAVFGRVSEKETDTDGFDFNGGPLQGLPVDDLSFSDTEDRTFGVVTSLGTFDGRSVSRLSLEHTDTDLDGGTFGSEAERQQIRFDTTWHWTAGREQRTTVFVQHEEEEFTNPYPFDPSQAPTQERDLLGYGVEHRLGINDNLFVNGILRRDKNDDFEDETTYSVDIAYLLGVKESVKESVTDESSTRIHASYGRGVTNPTFFEQFGFVPGTFIGNPNLTPEKSEGWDFGVEQTLADGALVLGLTYFDADLEDEIQTIFPSVSNTAGESERSGVELEFTYQPDPSTFISLEYTYTDSEEPAGKEVRRPEHTASMSAGKSFLADRLSFTGSVIYNGEQFDTDFRNFFSNGFLAEQTELESFVLVNLGVSFAASERIEVYGRLENLFDEDYQEVLGYAAPGRTVLGGVRIRLGD